MSENLLIALWKESGCDEREEFLKFLDGLYSLDRLKKALEDCAKGGKWISSKNSPTSNS